MKGIAYFTVGNLQDFTMAPEQGPEPLELLEIVQETPEAVNA